MKNVQLGIIGGGQLGLLLTQAAIAFPVHVSVYDPDPDCPAAPFTREFTQGEFEDHEALMAFGQGKDALIFETEKINIKALLDLEKKGIKVLSSPATLKWIQDKGWQKQYLKEMGFPVPSFTCVSAEQVRDYSGPFPIVQKWRTGGYDGYGVQVHADASSIAQATKKDSLMEEKVKISQEISMIMVRNRSGELKIYPPVEMVFDPEANLVDHLIAPARLKTEQVEALNTLCRQMAEKLDFIGVYAVEFFIDAEQKLSINEISPRPHNSGHHTVSANITSQYEQQIRVALDLPLGSTEQISPCVLVNLLAEEASGPTCYKGLKEVYAIPHVQYTLYGKKNVRPGRKMGHALILEENIDTALKKMETIRRTLTITSYES